MAKPDAVWLHQKDSKEDDVHQKPPGRSTLSPKSKFHQLLLDLVDKVHYRQTLANKTKFGRNKANPEEKKFPKVQVLDSCFWRPYQRLARFCRVAGPMEFYRRKWIFHHFLHFRHYQGIIQALFHRRRPSLWSTNGVMNLGIFGHALVRCQSTS